ncbi:2Fe-2S iron-sulfur cluster-binding protein [Corynebacterium kroppenstedtii]|uniref:2Fe-2S iron-sulfur cluster-binding protein n=1 Tax=Corynebacterium sp. PCR 32 TaxID=3351342 RepID=UPI0030A0A358
MTPTNPTPCPATPPSNTATGPTPAATAHVVLDDTNRDIAWPEGTTLLDAMLDAGLDAPYGCTEGECGACQCIITPHDDATSTMVHNNVLDDYDIEDNMTLACQTISTTPGGTFDVSYNL